MCWPMVQIEPASPTASGSRPSPFNKPGRPAVQPNRGPIRETAHGITPQTKANRTYATPRGIVLGRLLSGGPDGFMAFIVLLYPLQAAPRKLSFRPVSQRRSLSPDAPALAAGAREERRDFAGTLPIFPEN